MENHSSLGELIAAYEKKDGWEEVPIVNKYECGTCKKLVCPHQESAESLNRKFRFYEKKHENGTFYRRVERKYQLIKA